MWHDLVNFAVHHGISTILLLALLNFVTGVAAAVYTNTFKWTVIGMILHKIGPMLVVFVAIKLFANPDFAPGVLALITAQVGADVTKNIAEIVGGTIPDILNVKTEKTV